MSVTENISRPDGGSSPAIQKRMPCGIGHDTLSLPWRAVSAGVGAGCLSGGRMLHLPLLQVTEMSVNVDSLVFIYPIFDGSLMVFQFFGAKILFFTWFYHNGQKP